MTHARDGAALLLLLFLLLSGGCSAKTDPELPAVWTTIDGARVTPLAPAPGRIHVLLFVTPDCPIANSYAPAIATLADEARGTEVSLFLVHVDPGVDAAAAAAHARAYGLDLPILLDPRQQLARAVAATVTPTAAVLSAHGLQYCGRIDDRWRQLGSDGQVAEHPDLRDALAALRAGRAVPTPRTAAVGCLLPEPRH